MRRGLGSTEIVAKQKQLPLRVLFPVQRAVFRGTRRIKGIGDVRTRDFQTKLRLGQCGFGITEGNGTGCFVRHRVGGVFRERGLSGRTDFDGDDRFPGAFRELRLDFIMAKRFDVHRLHQPVLVRQHQARGVLGVVDVAGDPFLVGHKEGAGWAVVDRDTVNGVALAVRGVRPINVDFSLGMRTTPEIFTFDDDMGGTHTATLFWQIFRVLWVRHFRRWVGTASRWGVVPTIFAGEIVVPSLPSPIANLNRVDNGGVVVEDKSFVFGVVGRRLPANFDVHGMVQARSDGQIELKHGVVGKDGHANDVASSNLDCSVSFVNGAKMFPNHRDQLMGGFDEHPGCVHHLSW